VAGVEPTTPRELSSRFFGTFSLLAAMNFPRFWAKERGSVPKGWRGKLLFECWGWSDVSQADAEKMAREKAERIAQHLRATQRPPDRYGYGTRPLREEVLRAIKGSDGSLVAAITRNQYGCLVLNTARAMFVDIDVGELEIPQNRAFSFFRKAKTVSVDDVIGPHVQRVEQWTANRPDWSWRIYRTRAGLRLLATHSPIDVAAAESIFEALGADPLYRKLCANQKSYRARLTPKPWRIDHSKGRVQWPWPNAKAEASFKVWETKYLQKSADYATCRFLKVAGSGATHPELAHISEVHDQATQAHTSLALA
jgi:hypothetical protein